MSDVIVMPIVSKDPNAKQLVQSRLSKEDFRELERIAGIAWGGDIERASSEILRFNINMLSMLRLR